MGICTRVVRNGTNGHHNGAALEGFIHNESIKVFGWVKSHTRPVAVYLDLTG